MYINITKKFKKDHKFIITKLKFSKNLEYIYNI